MTYRSAAGARAGVLLGERVVDAWEALKEPARSSLRELIAEGRLGDLAEGFRASVGPGSIPPGRRTRRSS